MAKDAKDTAPAQDDQPATPPPATYSAAQFDDAVRDALKAHNDRLVVILKEIDAYHVKSQAGGLVSEDEKRIGVTLAHFHEIVESHKPLPPLPSLLAVSP